MNPTPDRDSLNAATDLEREREALEIWQADRRARLAENLLAHRPAEFAAPGHLDPRLAGWAEELAAKRGGT